MSSPSDSTTMVSETLPPSRPNPRFLVCYPRMNLFFVCTPSLSSSWRWFLGPGGIKSSKLSSLVTRMPRWRPTCSSRTPSNPPRLVSHIVGRLVLYHFVAAAATVRLVLPACELEPHFAMTDANVCNVEKWWTGGVGILLTWVVRRAEASKARFATRTGLIDVTLSFRAGQAVLSSTWLCR